MLKAVFPLPMLGFFYTMALWMQSQAGSCVEKDLHADDECNDGEEACGLNALQRKVRKLHDEWQLKVAELQEKTFNNSVLIALDDSCLEQGKYYIQSHGHKTMTGTTRTLETSSQACQKRCASTPGCAHFSWWYDHGCLLTDSSAYVRSFHIAEKVVAGPPTCIQAEASASGTEVSAANLSTATAPSKNCRSIHHPSNSVCKEPVTWAHGNGKYDPHAADWFKDMETISHVKYTEASLGDWQKLYFCAPPGGKQCGSPPCQCSHPPCDQCFAGEQREISGCAADPDAIYCKPPKRALDYNGLAWEDIKVTGAGPTFTVFAIGDWGGLDGSLNPIEGRPNLVAYAGGGKAGPSVFPRTRLNKDHSVMLCNHKQFVACYISGGRGGCDPGCGFVPGVDDRPQLLVADAFKKRAALKDPKFILNVGDNFYWGGIEKTCGTPMDTLSYTAHHQFQNIYESVYHGPGVDGKVWISALGNHDWGGRQFTNGWDQQIAYTWKSSRWIMPAAYYSVHVEFTDAGFSMDVFVLDSNAMDAEDPPKDPNHNICGSEHNPSDANCASQGGPPSVSGCKEWFWKMWRDEQQWLPKKLDESKADWQVVVTHFPCGHQAGFYKEMHNSHGLDLLVTGHRHNQELWSPGRLGGLQCFVTGGGGGISSEATPNPHNKRDWYGEAQYGFFDLTVSKEKIIVTSINWDGTELLSRTVYPK